VWSQDLLSPLPGKLTKNKRQLCKLTIKYKFATFKKIKHNGIESASFFFSWIYVYIDLIFFILRLKFCLSACLLLTCRSSSLQSAACTAVSLQPLHLPQALTLRTKLPFANTIHLVHVVLTVKNVCYPYKAPCCMGSSFCRRTQIFIHEKFYKQFVFQILK